MQSVGGGPLPGHLLWAGPTPPAGWLNVKRTQLDGSHVLEEDSTRFGGVPGRFEDQGPMWLAEGKFILFQEKNALDSAKLI